MSMQKPSMDELRSSTDNTDDDDETDDDSNSVAEEIVNAPSLKLSPEVGLYFEGIADIGFTGDVDYAQNFRGDERKNLGEEPTGGYGGSIAITFEDPSVGDGQLWQSSDEDQTVDYRLVGDETTAEWTKEIDDEEHTFGIKYGQGNTSNYEANAVEEFDTEYVTAYLNGSLAEYIVARLDAYGQEWDGTYEEPAGLFEYAPDDSEYGTAIRRNPILRSDMEDRAGALLVTLGNNGAYLGNIFTFDDEGDFAELETIDSMDHDGYRDTTDAYIASELTFDHEDVDDDETVEDATDDLSFDAVETDDDTDETGGTLVFYDDLSMEWQAFVDNLHKADGIDLDEYDVAGAAEKFADDNDLSFEMASADDIQRIVRDTA